MISISLTKNELNGKQFVNSWCFVTKEHTEKYPMVPGKRIYLDQTQIPLSFYSNPMIYYYEAEQLIPLYPNSDPLAKKLSN